jgi:hypothetical protein
MTTIREQDALTVFREGVFLSRAARDRRALLVAGDALAEAAQQSAEARHVIAHGLAQMAIGPVDFEQCRRVGCVAARAALGAWKAATG